ncbi:MAG: methionyl-tRNA formyltransferase [Rhodobacteraceae bacterium]|nr:MAG: methionyl-tRNA formyltransferase [Paracoccaceae bacterium]|tara:strand:- start:1782 stop:2711 length:930 start_codon:yes stop_codon:yes gene_type:complete
MTGHCMRVIFMGTSSFGVPTLQALIDNNCKVVGVYTQPPRPAGRGKKLRMSPIGLFAQKHDLKLRFPEDFSSSFEISEFESLQPDIVIVVAYGLILPKKLLTISKFKFFNIHASLLPRWRGAAPIQRALLAGDKKTGISIIELEPSLDTGPIVLQRYLAIESYDNMGTIYEKLSHIGANLIGELFKTIQTPSFVAQGSEGVKYAKKIEKSETQIDWCNGARAIDCKVRAFSPSPGAWFALEGERIKILACQVSNGAGDPGVVLDEYFQVACGNGSIFPTVLQRAGKSPLNATEFLRGYKAPVGVTLIKC